MDYEIEYVVNVDLGNRTEFVGFRSYFAARMRAREYFYRINGVVKVTITDAHTGECYWYLDGEEIWENNPDPNLIPIVEVR